MITIATSITNVSINFCLQYPDTATNHTIPVCIQLTAEHQNKQIELQQLAINVDTMTKTARTTKH